MAALALAGLAMLENFVVSFVVSFVDA